MRGRKSAGKSAPGQPFRKGQDSRRGRGPAKGSGGRPPAAFTDWLRQWFDEPETREALKRMAFAEPSVMNRLLAYAEGLPQQPVEVSGVLRIVIDE